MPGGKCKGVTCCKTCHEAVHDYFIRVKYVVGTKVIVLPMPNRYVVPEAMSSDAKSARSERQHATAKEKKERELREKERELREKKRKQEHEEKKATKKKKLEEEG